MRTTLITLIALFIAAPAQAAPDIFIKISTLSPLDSVPMDEDAAVVDAVVGNGELVPAKAVHRDDIGHGGFAGSIINAIVLTDAPTAYDTAWIDGKDTELTRVMTLSMKNRTPVLLDTPDGLQIFSIDTPSNLVETAANTNGIDVLAWVTAGIESVESSDGDRAALESDPHEASDGGFAGSVVSLQADSKASLTALYAGGEEVPVQSRATLSSKLDALVIAVGPQSLVVYALD